MKYHVKKKKKKQSYEISTNVAKRITFIWIIFMKYLKYY